MTGNATTFHNCIVEYNDSGVPTGTVWIDGVRYTSASSSIPSGPVQPKSASGKYTISVGSFSGANLASGSSTTQKDASSVANSSGTQGVSEGETGGATLGTAVEIVKPGQSEDANAINNTALVST